MQIYPFSLSEITCLISHAISRGSQLPGFLSSICRHAICTSNCESCNRTVTCFVTPLNNIMLSIDTQCRSTRSILVPCYRNPTLIDDGTISSPVFAIAPHSTRNRSRENIICIRWKRRITTLLGCVLEGGVDATRSITYSGWSLKPKRMPVPCVLLEAISSFDLTRQHHGSPASTPAWY
jgi:hypothetical protein